MARLPRLSVPGLVHYAILRARSGIMPFAHEDHCSQAIDLIGTHARRFGIEWHGFVLMPDAAHLLVTPPEANSLSQLIQAFGRQFVPSFNRATGHRGSPWDGRFRATVIDADDYLLDAMFSLDIKPVVQNLAGRAHEYAWSSHRHYIGQGANPWLTPPPQYWALGNTPFAREAHYSERFAVGVPTERQRQLESAALRGWAMGGEAFLDQLEGVTQRRTRPARVGRPSGSSKPQVLDQRF